MGTAAQRTRFAAGRGCTRVGYGIEPSGEAVVGKRRSVPGMLKGSPSAEARMPAVPKLAISTVLAQPERYDPDTRYSFRYRAKGHRELPHVVKFSGGRSSGLLVFTLVENGFLKRERGDVVIFNNTSCEHPETYKFVSECKDRVEERGIPFFLTEFQTYEDARRGEWRRLPSYRLVNDRPFSDRNPDGYRWRGEIFEEMLSYKGYLPEPIQPCLHSVAQAGCDA